jgi:hypothetical protein
VNLDGMAGEIISDGDGVSTWGEMDGGFGGAQIFAYVLESQTADLGFSQ